MSLPALGIYSSFVKVYSFSHERSVVHQSIQLVFLLSQEWSLLILAWVLKIEACHFLKHDVHWVLVDFF